MIMDMHLCVITKYWAASRGRGYGYVYGYGHGFGYNNHAYRCRVMGYVTTLVLTA